MNSRFVLFTLFQFFCFQKGNKQKFFYALVVILVGKDINFILLLLLFLSFPIFQKAGINRHFAQTIGIAVDHRRRNKSEGTLAVNVQRLKEYQSKLILFPRNSKKPKAGDSPAEVLKGVRQATGTIQPIKKRSPKAQSRTITEEEKKTSAYWQLRRARADARLVGFRKKKAQQKEETQK
jgi:large subunit ribosomal protein L13e